MPDRRDARPTSFRVPGVVQLYRQLPEELRRGLRPLNLLDELASFLPPAARAATAIATEAVRRLVQLRHIRYPLRRLDGAGHHGRRLVCLLAVDELSARYWTKTLFPEPPTERLLGQVAALETRQAAERHAGSEDLALWQVPWPASRRVNAAALVPSSVPLWLDTSRPFDVILAGERHGRSSRKDDARRVRRLGLRTRLATGLRDHEHFRRALYEPYAQRRFGDLFLRVPPHAFRHARRAGWLLLLEHGGRAVAGAMLERWNRDVRILAFGVETESRLPTGLLLEACYYHAIRFAVDSGFPRLSLGTARPVLSDGVLRYKRKWGAWIGRPNTWEVFALRYRNTPALRSALEAVPLVLDRGRYGLAALFAGGHTALAAIDTPGLTERACLIDGEPSGGNPSPRGVHLIPAPAVWPPEAGLVSTAPAPEPVPVGDLLGGPASSDPEDALRSAHRN